MSVRERKNRFLKFILGKAHLGCLGKVWKKTFLKNWIQENVKKNDHVPTNVFQMIKTAYIWKILHSNRLYNFHQKVLTPLSKKRWCKQKTQFNKFRMHFDVKHKTTLDIINCDNPQTDFWDIIGNYLNRFAFVTLCHS